MDAVSPDREHPLDPILAKRRQIARLVDIGQRVGYGLFGLAIVAFALGLAQKLPIKTNLRRASATGALTCLKVGARTALPFKASVDALCGGFCNAADD